jgi:hypothetical protein
MLSCSCSISTSLVMEITGVSGSSSRTRCYGMETCVHVVSFDWIGMSAKHISPLE